MMPLTKYRTTALAVSIDGKQPVAYADINPGVLLGIVGLCSEVGEVFEAVTQATLGACPISVVQDELGDCLWYLNLLADALGIGLDELPDVEGDAATDIYVSSARLADYVKKAMFRQGYEIDRQKVLDQAARVLASVRAMALGTGATVEEIAYRNVSKLVARHDGNLLRGVQ